ncbi:hypothetical protein [Nocardia nova]|nr:hypothetical protein [Nocardia nova]
MVVSDVVVGEIAKAMAASMAGAGIRSGGRLWQLIKARVARRPTGEPKTVEQWRDFVNDCASEDPELFDQLALAVAEANPVVPSDEYRAVFAPPVPFWDRDSLRDRLPEYGVYGFAGPHGCGKAALVQQLAVDRSARFPVYRARVDLDRVRTGDLLRVAEAERLVLRQLGITDIASSHQGLRRQYEAVLATRRPLLLILENVLSADELTALVGTWPKALVLVTTRHLTADLQACAVHWTELDGLDREGARALLAQWCPGLRIDAESAAVDALLHRFGRMPHAIRLLGRILLRRVSEPKPVAGLLTEFDEAGIDGTDGLLGAFVSGQVAQVPDDIRDAFRLLAVYPAGQFSVATASILLDHPQHRTRNIIERLRELGLLEVSDGGRFRMAWSIRRYVTEHDASADSAAALDRLLAHYAARGVAADLAEGPRMRYYRIPDTGRWPDDEDRIRWLDIEAEAIAELVEYAYLHGRDDEVGQLCGALEVLSLHRGRYELCLAAYERGVRAARRQDSRPLLARQHALCGRTATLLHRFEHARTELAAAQAIASELGDPALTSSVWEFTGRLAEEQAGAGAMPDWRPAIEAYANALEIDRATAADRARGLHARMLANVLVKAGVAEQAGPLLQEAHAHTRGDRNMSRVLTVWVKFAIARGDLDDALGNHQRAVQHAAAAGADQYSVELDDLVAEIEFRRKRFAEARSTWAAIAQSYVDQGHPRAMEFFAKLNRLPPGP